MKARTGVSVLVTRLIASVMPWVAVDVVTAMELTPASWSDICCIPDDSADAMDC